MSEYFHVDLSLRLYEQGTTGIACINSKTKIHNGCALPDRLKRQIEKNFVGGLRENYAKLYAICIYYLIINKLEEINTLVICNDEEFLYVKEYLYFLLNDSPFRIHIISITEFRKQLGGRKIKSLADNASKSYRKRALKMNKWDIGVKLDVLTITYDMIKNKFDLLSKLK